MNDKTKSNDLIINQQKSLPQEINKIKIENRITGDLIEPEDDIKKNNKMNILSAEQGNPEPPKKIIDYRKISFLVIIFAILLCVALFFIIKLVYMKIKDKYFSSSYYNKENKITAIYKGEFGQVKIINDDYYGKKINKYKINMGERVLNVDDIDVEKGKYNYTDNDTVKIEIYFNSILTSLDNMFEGCEQLIYVDLSDLITRRIKTLSHTFNNCKNLQKIDLSSLKDSIITSMDSLFEGCNNLIDIKGMEQLNTIYLKNIQNMFVNCENLIFVNLSSFELEKIENNRKIFDKNPSLRYIDMSNSKYDNNLIPIFNQEYFNERNNNEKILIRIKEVPESNNVSWIEYKTNDDVFNISCIIGENEKCKSCSKNNETLLNCQTCNEGYYLPYGYILNIYTNTKCRKCNDNCKECEGDYYNNYCTKCKDGFSLEFQECKGNTTEGTKEDEDKKEDKKENITEETKEDEDKKEDKKENKTEDTKEDENKKGDKKEDKNEEDKENEVSENENEIDKEKNETIKNKENSENSSNNKTVIEEKEEESDKIKDNDKEAKKENEEEFKEIIKEEEEHEKSVDVKEEEKESKEKELSSEKENKKEKENNNEVNN